MKSAIKLRGLTCGTNLLLVTGSLDHQFPPRFFCNKNTALSYRTGIFSGHQSHLFGDFLCLHLQGIMWWINGYILGEQQNTQSVHRIYKSTQSCSAAVTNHANCSAVFSTFKSALTWTVRCAAAADSLCSLTQFCFTKLSVYSTARAYRKELHSLHADIIPDGSLSLSFPTYVMMSWIVPRCISPLSHLIPPANLQRTMVALKGWYIHITNSSFHADTTSFWNGELLFWVDVVGSLRRLNHPVIVATLAVYKKQLTKWYIKPP